MKLIDKDKIAAEIEKRRRDWRYGSSIEAKFKREECDDILSFLDTLETKEVDLEEELERLDRILYDLDGVAIKGATCYLTVEDVKYIAKRFYELGLKAKDVNEIIKTAEDHAYFAGSENTREKLIEKACKWLRKELVNFEDYSGMGEELISDFRKAMEE